MSYVGWLVLVSGVFVLLERCWPRRRPQPVLRRGWTLDLAYLVLNGHFLGVWLASVSRPLAQMVQEQLALHGPAFGWQSAVAGSWPWWLQFVVAFVGLDLLQWCIHNLLHRVPWLWQLHQVHHSIEEMDWAGSLRIHWGEILVYRTLQYLPLVWFGFSDSVLFVHAIVGTAIGHLNHANLGWTLGPLRYVFNNPAMHIWHHVHDEAGPTQRNFGINLSVWDWIFGTAWLPDAPPERLGFSGIEQFPRTLPGQLLHPLPVERWVHRIRAGSRTRQGSATGAAPPDCSAQNLPES